MTRHAIRKLWTSSFHMSALLHKRLSTSSLFAWCGVDAATPTGTKARGHFTATPANVPGVSRLCKAKGLGGLGPTFEPQHLLSDMTCIKSHVSTQACYVTSSFHMSALLHKQLSTSSLFAWCGVDAATPTGTKARGHFTATPANVPGVSRLCKAKGLGGLGPTFEPQHLLSDMTCIKSHVSTQACYVTSSFHMSALLHKQLSTSSLFAWCGVDAAAPTGTKARGHFTATLRPVSPAKLSGEVHRAAKLQA